MRDWHESQAYQRLMASKPGPTAPPEERARWEEEALRVGEAWLGAKMKYPPTFSAEEREAKEERLAVIDEELQVLAPDAPASALKVPVILYA